MRSPVVDSGDADEVIMDVERLISALDQRILDAIDAKATGETIVKLCEARAWLTNPGQPHAATHDHG
jgi:hypothetical protein